MGLKSKLTALGKTSIDTVTENSVKILGWGALGLASGMLTCGLYNAFVEGRYDGNLFEQAAAGIKDAIPLVSDDKWYNVLGKDLSAAAINLGIVKSQSMFNSVKNSTSQSYQEYQQVEAQKDEVDNQVSLEKYKIRQTQKLEEYKAQVQRSPTMAE